jgi:hypothetical protein
MIDMTTSNSTSVKARRRASDREQLGCAEPLGRTVDRAKINIVRQLLGLSNCEGNSARGFDAYVSNVAPRQNSTRVLKHFAYRKSVAACISGKREKSTFFSAGARIQEKAAWIFRRRRRRFFRRDADPSAC